MFGIKIGKNGAENNAGIVTDDAKIEEVLTRGVENIFPNKEFLKSRLIKGERMTFYLGADPTAPSLHLGHAIPIKKLGELQKLGHRVIFLIGDYTAMIGDPDKATTRKQLTHEQVLENCRKYKDQASAFILFTGPNKAELKFNSTWLSKLTFADTLNLISHVSHAQLVKRDMFQERISQSKDLFMHELMYPIMQGYDSVAMDVDGELGGNDQTFNMLVGRDLMKKMKNKEKFVIATKLLTDSEGRKMGKTEGNMVSLDQTPEDMFGKVMSWSDGLIMPGFELITDIPMFEIKQMESEIQRGANPKDYKIKLAKEIVTMIHGADSAKKAQKSFENTFKKGEVPENIMDLRTARGASLRDLLVGAKIVASNAEWRRLIEGNAITILETEEVIKDPLTRLEKEMILRIGKKRFVRVSVK